MNRASAHRGLSFVLAFFVAVTLVPATSTAAIFEEGFEKETVASGFILPVAMAFTPDGRIFVAEKGGTVRVIKNGAVNAQPLLTLTDTNTYGDRGLLGIAVDPNFLTNGYVYLSYTYENTPGSNFSGVKTGRIVRVTVEGDTANLSTMVVLLGTEGGSAVAPSCENFPVESDCIPSDSPSHSVGGLRFGPDGMLYATLGEGANFDYADPLSLRAQNLDSLAGKVVRINTDGTAPADNPFYNGDPNANRSKVYALGLRNAFRLNFNPNNGALFVGDVGWSTWEEINHVTPGANFGWPCYEGDIKTIHNCEASSATSSAVYPYLHDSNFAGSVVAGSFPDNGAYPAEYDSSLFIGDYAQNWIKRIILDENNALVSVEDFMDDPDGPVDISTGPDGMVYFLSIYTGELNRLTHTTGNRRPVVEVAATPTAGLIPLEVAFSSVGSYDPDGDAITYFWNFDDGETSTDANPVHTFTTDDTYNVTLNVTDALGASTAASIAITAGNQAPQAEILSPANGTLYSPFDIIQMNAQAFDLEDGELPASAFNWQIILHHNTHIHVIQEFIGTKNPWFMAPDHNAADVYTEVILTVTDSTGLTRTVSVNLYLNTNTQTGNLINNPSVETEAGAVPPRPENWERGGWGVNTRFLDYPVAGTEGTKGLLTQITAYESGDAKWFFLPVNVTPGRTYIYSDVYTADVPTHLSAQFGFSNGTFQFQYLGEVPAAATPTQIEQAIIVPAGVQTLSVFHSLQQVGTLYTDNFSLMLEGAGTTTSNNLIVNGSFEEENGAQPLGWSPVVTPGTTAAFTYPTLGVDGGKAVNITITAIGEEGNARYQFDEVPIVTGTEYTYEEYYKSSTIHDIIGRYTFNDGSEHFFGLEKEIPPATEWTKVEGKFVAPENVASVTLMSQISTNATLDLDAVRMFASGTGTPSEIIAPEVAFTVPLEGATVSGIITLTATATDNVGVTGWFFAVDGTPLHLESSDPVISFVWDSTTVSNGVHNLKITAQDAVGNNNRQIISVMVDNTPVPPTASNLIANPSFEFTGAGGNPQNWLRGGWGTNDRTFVYPVAGTEGDRAARVEITSFTSGDAKWYFTDVPVVGGRTYVINYDARSNVPTDVLARITRADGSYQYLYLGYVPANTVWGNLAYDIVVPENGTHVTLFHVLSSVGWLEVDNFLMYDPSVVLDTTAPSVTFGMIATGTTPASGVITLSATATDDVAVTEVRLLVNGALGPIATFSAIEGTYNVTWDSTTVPNGVHELVFQAADAAGNIGTSSSQMITIENTAPALESLVLNASLEVAGLGGNPEGWLRGGWGTNTRTFTYPVAGSHGESAARVEITSFTSGDAKWYFADVPVSAGTTYDLAFDYRSNVATDVLARVQLSGGSYQYLYLGNVPANTTWGGLAYEIVAPAGAEALTIFHIVSSVGWLEVDSFVLADATVPVVDTVAPVVSLGAITPATTPASGTVTIAVNATDNTAVTQVELLVNGAPTGLVDTTASFAIALDTTTLLDGAYTLSVRARDAAGNVATSSAMAFQIQNSTTTRLISLIANPSFEDAGVGSNPAQWLSSRWGTNTTVFTYPVAGSHGEDAARVEMSSYTSGDAKWYHAEVPVTPGSSYTLTHQYRSNVTTNITARYTRPDGTYLYVGFGNPAASAAWATNTYTFSVPENVTSMTIMHILNQVGWLETDSFALVSGNTNQFGNAMISLTFDDGWLSHYTAARPILDASNVDGVFYITTDYTYGAIPVELLANTSLEVVAVSGDPEGWSRGGWGDNTRVYEYPVAGNNSASAAKVTMTSRITGDAKWYPANATVIPGEEYVFKSDYLSSVPTEMILRYTTSGGVFQYQYLATVPATNGAWATFTRTVQVPAGVTGVTMFHVIYSIGELTVDNYSVTRVPDFMNVSQVLELQASGHEIGAHTRSHPNLTTLTTAEATTEISGSRADLLSMGIAAVDSIAYPYGEYNAEIQALSESAGHTSGRGVARGFNTKATDHFALMVQSMNRTTTLAQLQGWIAQAQADNTWLILMFHQIDDNLAAEHGITAELLEQSVGAILSSGIEVVSVTEGLSRMNP